MQHILVDYLTLSVSASQFTVDDMLQRLSMKIKEFAEIKSRLGLTKCLYCGGIKIHYHEDVQEKKPLIVLEMSGQGCRLLETVKNNNINWIDFIEQFLSTEGSHLARLDIACDDKVETEECKPILSFLTMVRHLKGRRYISLANRKMYTDLDEQNIYLGSPTSDRRLRIYNKALERNYDKHWIRAEFQLRNQAALSFYMRALEIGDIGKTYYGVLMNYLRFTKEENNVEHGNQNRLTVTRWWNTFCHGASKIKGFYVGGTDYNIGRLTDYLRTQPASSVQTMLTLNEGDVSAVLELFAGAELNKKQDFLVRTEKLKREINKTYEKEFQFRQWCESEGIDLIV